MRDLTTHEPITSLPEDEVEDVRDVMIEQQVRRVRGVTSRPRRYSAQPWSRPLLGLAVLFLLRLLG